MRHVSRLLRARVVETLYALLERGPAAVVLLDGRRRVVYANDRTAATAARQDGISFVNGALALWRKADDSRLQLARSSAF